MKRIVLVAAVLTVVVFAAGIALSQQVIEPNALKLNPPSYRNSYVKIKDVFINNRAGIPVALTASGYTSQKYLTFGARKAGMRCFMRRDSVNEQTLGQFKPGDQVTITGYVKQPKATVGKNRFKRKEKLDIYLIEVSTIKKGWE